MHTYIYIYIYTYIYNTYIYIYIYRLLSTTLQGSAAHHSLFTLSQGVKGGERQGENRGTEQLWRVATAYM